MSDLAALRDIAEAARDMELAYYTALAAQQQEPRRVDLFEATQEADVARINADDALRAVWTSEVRLALLDTITAAQPFVDYYRHADLKGIKLAPPSLNREHAKALFEAFEALALLAGRLPEEQSDE